MSSWWVKREKRGVWHLASAWELDDSVVNTYCGRRMKAVHYPIIEGGSLVTLSLPPFYETACKVCRTQARLPLIPEYES